MKTPHSTFEPRHGFNYLFAVIFWLLFALLCGHAKSESHMSPVPFFMENNRSPVSDYVRWFHERAPARLESALRHAKVVEFTAKLYGVDPLLVAVIVSCESSWRANATGRLGVKGLMQTHGAASKGFDTSTPEGQIESGVAWLRQGIRKCGEGPRALAWYGGAGCTKPKWATWRWKQYEKAKRRFGNEKN